MIYLDDFRFSDVRGTEPTVPFFGFGKGPRDCPGRRLALMEAKFILVSLLSNFRLKETEDIRKPLDLEFRGITIGIKGDRFRVGVEKRDD